MYTVKIYDKNGDLLVMKDDVYSYQMLPEKIFSMLGKYSDQLYVLDIGNQIIVFENEESDES